MPDCRSVAALVRGFTDDSDGEFVKSRDLILHLLEFTLDPFSRQQFTPGHITCTGLVQSPDRSRVLVVHHNRLDRWLLPGGHVEEDDAEIWDGARREVVEETGVVLQPRIARLIGVDVHGIPPGKGEPYHLHHDLLFGYQAESVEFRLSHESRAISWATPAEFERFALPLNVRRAWARATG
jgi:8-oxo-dGTP pyrophosphatase MutT (NUDIX family)